MKRTAREFRAKAKGCGSAEQVGTAVALAAELHIERSQSRCWRKQLERLDKKEHREQSKERALARESLRLKQAIETKTLIPSEELPVCAESFFTLDSSQDWKCCRSRRICEIREATSL